MHSADASTRASRRSSFAPAGECRSRNRSSCFGLIECTAKPRSIRLSTTGPRGVSIATPTAPASPANASSQSASADNPSPPSAKCDLGKSAATAITVIQRSFRVVHYRVPPFAHGHIGLSKPGTIADVLRRINRLYWFTQGNRIWIRAIAFGAS